MAFVFKKSPGSYLKTTVVHVDSNNDNEQQSDYKYTARLDQGIQDVLSISLVSWQLDADIAPSFWPTKGGVAGSDTLDFSLSNANVNGGTPFQFSVRLPNKTFYFSNDAPSGRRMSNLLIDLMNEQIASEPLLPDVRVSYDNTYEQRLVLLCTTSNVFVTGLARDTFLALNFATGPNAARSCHEQLGFEKADYTSYEQSLYFFIGFQSATLLSSPRLPKLQQFKYIDLFLEESSKAPVQRLYLTNPYAFRTGASGSVYKQNRIDTDKAPAHLHSLSVSFRLQGDKNPSLYQSFPVFSKLTFAILSVAQETADLPVYVKQTLIA